MPNFYDAETAFSDLFTDMSTYEDLLTPEHVDPVTPEELTEVYDEYDADYNEVVTRAIRLGEIQTQLYDAYTALEDAETEWAAAQREVAEIEYRLDATECACAFCQDERWELQ